MSLVPLITMFTVLFWTLPAFGGIPELACMQPQGNTHSEVHQNCYNCEMALNSGRADASSLNRCATLASGWCSEYVGADMCNPDPALSKGCAGTMAACRVAPIENEPTSALTCSAGLTARDGKCYCADLTTTASLASQCPTIRPKQRPGNLGGADPSAAPQSQGDESNISVSQIQADINQCQGSNGTANRCCVSDPMSCVSSPSAQGATPPPPQQTGDPAQDQASIQRYCAQLDAASATGANANSNAGQMCLSKYKICENTCGSLANKYSSALQQSPNSPNANQYRQAVQTLNQLQGRCSDMAPQVQLLGRQTIATNSASRQSALCSGLARAMPSSIPAFGSGSGQNIGDPCAMDPTSAACARCTENPELAGCSKGDSRGGQASFDSGDSSKSPGDSEFNLPDLGDMQTGDPSTIGGGKPGDVPSVKTVANNAGGGIPGGGGGGASASLGANGRGGGSPGSAGYTTDVLNGFTGAGGGSGFNSQATGVGADPQGYNTGGSFGSDGRNPSGLGTDLKKYLPGGELDPHARFGGNSTISAQIHGKNVDIWGKISTRFQEKCRLGILFDCNVATVPMKAK